MQKYRVDFCAGINSEECRTFVGFFEAESAADACDQASRMQVPDDEPFAASLTYRELHRLFLAATPVESFVLETERR